MAQPENSGSFQDSELAKLLDSSLNEAWEHEAKKQEEAFQTLYETVDDVLELAPDEQIGRSLHRTYLDEGEVRRTVLVAVRKYSVIGEVCRVIVNDVHRDIHLHNFVSASDYLLSLEEPVVTKSSGVIVQRPAANTWEGWDELHAMFIGIDRTGKIALQSSPNYRPMLPTMEVNQDAELISAIQRRRTAGELTALLQGLDRSTIKDDVNLIDIEGL